MMDEAAENGDKDLLLYMEELQKSKTMDEEKSHFDDADK